MEPHRKKSWSRCCGPRISRWLKIFWRKWKKIYRHLEWPSTMMGDSSTRRSLNTFSLNVWSKFFSIQMNNQPIFTTLSLIGYWSMKGSKWSKRINRVKQRKTSRKRNCFSYAASSPNIVALLFTSQPIGTLCSQRRTCSIDTVDLRLLLQRRNRCQQNIHFWSRWTYICLGFSN